MKMVLDQATMDRALAVAMGSVVREAIENSGMQQTVSEVLSATVEKALPLVVHALEIAVFKGVALMAFGVDQGEPSKFDHGATASFEELKAKLGLGEDRPWPKVTTAPGEAPVVAGQSARTEVGSNFILKTPAGDVYIEWLDGKISVGRCGGPIDDVREEGEPSRDEIIQAFGKLVHAVDNEPVDGVSLKDALAAKDFLEPLLAGVPCEEHEG